MTTDRWRRIDTLYHEMLACPLDERAAALSAACAGDIELQTDVQSRLDQPQSSAGFLATAAPGVPQTRDAREAGGNVKCSG